MLNYLRSTWPVRKFMGQFESQLFLTILPDDVIVAIWLLIEAMLVGVWVSPLSPGSPHSCCDSAHDLLEIHLNILLTGAGGYIGGSVAHALHAAGHDARRLTRTSATAARLSATGITPVLGTLDDAVLLNREARATDGVINTASADHAARYRRLLHVSKGRENHCCTPAAPVLWATMHAATSARKTSSMRTRG